MSSVKGSTSGCTDQIWNLIWCAALIWWYIYNISRKEWSQALRLTSKQGCKRLSQNRPTNMSSGKWVGEAGVSWVVKNVIDDKSTYLPISFTLKLLYCCLFGNLNTPLLISMLVNKSRGLKKELINTLIKEAASAKPIFTTAIYPGKGKAFSSRVVSSKDWELESGGRRPFLCCNCPNAHSPHQLLSHKLRPPQLDNLNLMARFEGFRVIGRLGRLPGKPIRPHFLLHQLICNASRLVTFIFDIHWVKQNKVSSWLRNSNWSQLWQCVSALFCFSNLYIWPVYIDGSCV